MSDLIYPLHTGGETDRGIGRLRLTERLLTRWLSALEVGRLSVAFASGSRQTFGDTLAAPSASVRVNDPRIVARALLSGELGLAEGYMAGEWDTDDLTKLFTLVALNEDALSSTLSASWAARWLNRLIHARRGNTRVGSRRNIAAHYDLGNDFYRLWLDEGMTYSSALFAHRDEPLATGQRRKYLRIAEQLDLRPGDRLLEIGCGWGAFAEIAAAEFGCQVVGLTLSEAQAAYARDRISRAGLEDRVEIRIQDYRDVTGRFDKVASIEMFEAVGEENWADYYEAFDRCIVPGGRAALQVITIDDGKFEAYRRNPDFIQRYIFPGGMLPSPSAFTAASDNAGWRISDQHFFGKSYAETLRRWASRFQENLPAVEKLDFDARFCRMWRYYLSYCEVGFDSGQIDVGQFVMERR